MRIVERHGRAKKAGVRLYDPTYLSWMSLKQRCLDTNHHAYDRYKDLWYEPWARFSQFLADMGERPEGMTLDRIDNAKGYSPENCRWATPAMQQRNRKATKLDEEKAWEIRASRDRPTVLARRYGVSLPCICDVLAGRTWR
jgi:hypothetical protein